MIPINPMDRAYSISVASQLHLVRGKQRSEVLGEEAKEREKEELRR